MSRVVLVWADRTNTGKILASGVGTADAKSTRREGTHVRSLTRTSEVGVGNRRTVILIAAVVVAVALWPPRLSVTISDTVNVPSAR